MYEEKNKKNHTKNQNEKNKQKDEGLAHLSNETVLKFQDPKNPE